MKSESENGITQEIMKNTIAKEMKPEPENGMTQEITKDDIAREEHIEGK